MTDTIKKAIEATRKEQYAEALEMFKALYADGFDSGPVSGLSYYGLALAATKESPSSDAAEICEKAIVAQPEDPNHYTNLARIYIATGERKKALETLERGLRRLPHNGVIHRFWNTIGRRTAPTLPFLSRDNALNKAIGKARHQQKRATRTRKPKA